MLLPPSPVLAEEIVASSTPFWTLQAQVDLATESAEQCGINANHFRSTMSHEGGWNVNQQSQYPNPTGPNGLEDSWGDAQINLPAHSEITRDMANDPAFAIPWAADQWCKGHASMWTQYNLLKAKYGNGIWPE